MMMTWILDAATHIVDIMRDAEASGSRYHRDEDIAGIAATIARFHTFEERRWIDVGLDVDGVLRDCMKGLRTTFLQFHGHYGEDDIKPIVEWGLHDAYPIGHAIYDFMWKSHAWSVLNKNAPMYPGARQLIRDLSILSTVRISLVTSQPTYQSARATWAWLESKGILQSVGDVFMLGKNHRGKGHFGFHILVDDGPHNLEDCAKTPTLAVCFDRPWNQDYDGLRVKKYEALLKFMEAVSR